MKEITPELLEKYYQGLCTEEEQKQVETWLTSEEPKSPHEEKYLITSWQKIRYKTKLEQSPASARKRSLYGRLLGVAASVILLLSVSIFFYRDIVEETNDPTEVSYRTVATERGQKRTVNLPDGSTVRLNYETEIRIPEKFEDNERVVYLTGHAYFEVARDPEKPFIIYTENTKTKVLGTSFDINTKEKGETEIIVTRGKVAFSEKGQEVNQVMLTVNDRAVLSADKSISISEVYANRLTAWIDNRLVFDDVSLEKIIDILEPWYDVEINVENESLLQERFTYSYENPSIKKLMDSMSGMAGFEYQLKGKVVIIY
ncbi:MAG: FecR domain-containing protein [Bacteroidota bacterium]